MNAYAYPTGAHRRAAEEIRAYFAAREETDVVLLTNSCARGKATADSCLDMQVVVAPHAVAVVDEEWRQRAAGSKAIAELLSAGRFSDLHLDVTDGILVPGTIDEEGIDWFEVSAGNLFVYSVPLFVRGDRFARLGAYWLPYYGDTLRRERLDAARWFVLDSNLDRIPWLLDRELYFQALDRFFRAFQGFLLALHVSRRTYPIAYTSGSASRWPTTSGCRICTRSCRNSSSSTTSRVEPSQRRPPNYVALSRTTSSAESDPVRWQKLDPAVGTVG